MPLKKKELTRSLLFKTINKNALWIPYQEISFAISSNIYDPVQPEMETSPVAKSALREDTWSMHSNEPQMHIYGNGIVSEKYPKVALELTNYFAIPTLQCFILFFVFFLLSSSASLDRYAWQ